ncbi:MAG: type II toxin-antitoxin system PemK/MazF family toxin [Bacteroidales bacterium]|nr:type II toxin-antitoxin system PemK/MazF family toxin [Bacteroidales bacterium]
MKRGTIVLTRFPFTDLKSAKRRPAAIISKENPEKEDVIVAFITTSIPATLSNTDLLFDKTRNDFRKSGLKKVSLIKLDKIARLNTRIFTGELGSGSNQTLEEINEKLKMVFDLG